MEDTSTACTGKTHFLFSLCKNVVRARLASGGGLPMQALLPESPVMKQCHVAALKACDPRPVHN